MFIWEDWRDSIRSLHLDSQSDCTAGRGNGRGDKKGGYVGCAYFCLARTLNSFIINYLFFIIIFYSPHAHTPFYPTPQALSSDPTIIVRALRKSTGCVLEVNNEGDSVRRSPDNPPPDIFSAEQRQRMKAKTVYVVSWVWSCQYSNTCTHGIHFSIE